jgi:hypothetical protein
MEAKRKIRLGPATFISYEPGSTKSNGFFALIYAKIDLLLILMYPEVNEKIGKM